ncbi:MAG TPA: TPM domain-containing protein [Burkholderiaceae bacterium]|nr:TPM domain-containing protein [Burkholderiaceae bacterium]
MTGDSTTRPMRPRGARRWLRHWWIGPMHVRRAFPPAGFDAIERAIAEGERRHRAELRFAVESSLHSLQLWRGTSARERAVEVFSSCRIWDTEEDNGVLVYLLWADHAVEIVADRGAMRAVDPAVWTRACATLVDACRADRAVDGAVAAIRLLHDALARAFPADASAPNADELPDAPIRLG